jgi:hypothetical protein
MIKLRHLAVLVVSGIGAVGQAGLLFHELVDTYPFKVMSFPPPEFYERIGYAGVIIGPVIAVAAGIFWGRRRTWLAAVLPVGLCPLIFDAVFLLSTIARKLNVPEEVGRNFDNTDPFIVGVNFIIYTLGLAAVGSIVAAAFNFIIGRLTPTTLR